MYLSLFPLLPMLVSGQAGGALKFDGVNDAMVILQGVPWENYYRGKWTLEMWVQLTNPDRLGNTLIQFDSASGRNILGVNLHQTLPRTWSFTLGVDRLIGATRAEHILDGSLGILNEYPHHLAIVQSDEGPYGPGFLYLSVFVNGTAYVQQVVPAYSLQEGFGNFEIGAFLQQRKGESVHTGFFGGSVDEIRFWGTARSPAEILSSFQRGGLEGESGLLAYYPCDAKPFVETDRLRLEDSVNAASPGRLGGNVFDQAPTFVPSPVQGLLSGGSFFVSTPAGSEADLLAFLQADLPSLSLSSLTITASSPVSTLEIGAAPSTSSSFPLTLQEEGGEIRVKVLESGVLTLDLGSSGTFLLYLSASPTAAPKAGKSYAIQFFGHFGGISTFNFLSPFSPSFPAPLFPAWPDFPTGPFSFTVSFWIELHEVEQENFSSFWRVSSADGVANLIGTGMIDQHAGLQVEQYISLSPSVRSLSPQLVSFVLSSTGSFDQAGRLLYSAAIYKDCEGIVGYQGDIAMNFDIFTPAFWQSMTSGSLFGYDLGAGFEMNNFLSGTMDDIRIYDHARTPEQICTARNDPTPTPRRSSSSVLAASQAEGLYLWLPILEEDFSRPSSSCRAPSNTLGPSRDSCVALTNLGYSASLGLEAEAVCGVPDCGFDTRKGYSVVLSPMSVPGESRTVDAPVGASVPIGLPMHGYVSPYESPETDLSHVLVSLQASGSDLCGTLTNAQGSPLNMEGGINQLTSSQLPLSWTPSRACSGLLQYSLQDPNTGLSSPHPAQISLVSMESGPRLIAAELRELDYTQFVLRVQFDQATSAAPGSPLSGSELATLFELVRTSSSSGGQMSDAAVQAASTGVWSSDSTVLSIFLPTSVAAYLELSTVAFAISVKASQTSLTAQGTSLFYAAGTSDEILSVGGACPAGETYAGEQGGCSPCPAGSSRGAVDALNACVPCEPGRFTPDSASTSCQACPVGHAQPLAGQTSCLACAMGTHADETGLSECKECRPGFFSGTQGRALCLPCPRGSFQGSARASSCFPCEGEGQLTTAFEGAFDQSQCVCSASSYQPCIGSELTCELGASPLTCQTCLEGMLCPGGAIEHEEAEGRFVGSHLPCFDFLGDGTGRGCRHAPPRALPGYMTPPASPYEIYKCSTEEVCPGAPANQVEGLSVCSENREGIACGLCKEQFEGPVSKDCSSCSVGGSVVGLCFLIGAVFTGFSMVYKLTTSSYERTGMIPSAAVAIGVMLNSLQTVTVFNKLNLDFSNPFEDLQITASNVFTVDLLRRIGISQCLARSLIGGSSDPSLFLYASSAFFPILLCAAIVGVSRWRGKDMARTFNAIGGGLVALFIHLTINSIAPFRCYSHPDNRKSVVAFPTVLCWGDNNGGQHVWMVLFAVVTFLLYVVLVAAVLINAVLQAPSKLDTDKDFQLQYAFVFSKFRRSRYYWSLVLLGRNLCLSLITVIIPSDPSSQLVALSLVILPALYLQCVFWPWRTQLLNICDSVTLMAVMAIVVLSFAEIQEEKGAYSALMTIVFLGIFLLLSGTVFLAGREAMKKLAMAARQAASRASFSLTSFNFRKKDDRDDRNNSVDFGGPHLQAQSMSPLPPMSPESRIDDAFDIHLSINEGGKEPSSPSPDGESPKGSPQVQKPKKSEGVSVGFAGIEEEKSMAV